VSHEEWLEAPCRVDGDPAHAGAEGRIRVTIRFGAALSPASGQSRLIVTVAAGATIADLLSALSDLHPELALALPSALTIVDGSHVDPTRLLNNGEEVALLCAVAGG
jgi:molybdopterin converting factor small subunit